MSIVVNLQRPPLIVGSLLLNNVIQNLNLPEIPFFYIFFCKWKNRHPCLLSPLLHLMIRVLISDWSRVITGPGHWPLIGWARGWLPLHLIAPSLGLRYLMIQEAFLPALYLSGHQRLTSDWSRVIKWPIFWSLIGGVVFVRGPPEVGGVFRRGAEDSLYRGGFVAY